ncbi:MAG TPA: hypothetical protein VLG49_05430 [Rhabdochlamydiaceae bacterium]|nr:hypothetical protein [Rhabdochlamydiaceae bacterium]
MLRANTLLFLLSPFVLSAAEEVLFSPETHIEQPEFHADLNETEEEWPLYSLPAGCEDFNGPELLRKKEIVFDATPPFYEDSRYDPPPPLGPPEVLERKEPKILPNQEFEVNLKDPVFNHGVLMTEHGGVVKGEGIRIQAQKIEYINKIENGIPIQKVIAEGDLMIDYAGTVFVGRKLEYDFVKKSGMLDDGKTFVNVWFLGGKQIELQEDGSYIIHHAYITTCESQENTWDIDAGMVKITKEHLLSAKNIRLRFIKIPFLWFPSFKSNLKVFKDPPVKYKLTWDKGLGPRATLRYRFFSWERFSAYFRFDYRISRGPGAAIETDYKSLDKRTIFRTKNYGAFDKEVPDERSNKRFRLQGLIHTETPDHRTQVHMTWDKMRDDKMPADFKSDDFEVNTQKRTILFINHQGDNLYSSFRVQPRINSFQSLNQELPWFMAGMRPFEIGRTGVISENYINASFLDYIYVNKLHELVPNIHSVRAETQNMLYRPIPTPFLTITPHAGFIGIAYNNSPQHEARGQAILAYGGEILSRFSRAYAHLKHLIEPYAIYEGYTRPTVGLDKHFIFNIDDGYFLLDQLRLGVRNTLFSYRHSPFLGTVITDIYTYGFFDQRTYKKAFPKGYLDAEWNRTFYSLKGYFCWNFEEQVLDYSNIRADWTVSENFAFGLEFRHRSKFDWRKANHENFFLDVARTIPQLLASPLSDKRNTLLTRAQVRLSPKVTCHFESHHGWGRRKERRYNEEKVELFAMLPCNWRLKVAYQHMPNDNRFTGGVSLVK